MSINPIVLSPTTFDFTQFRKPGDIDFTDAWNAAIEYGNDYGGTIYIPPAPYPGWAPYTISSTPSVITGRGINIQGSGRAGTLQVADGITGVSILPVSVNGDANNHNGFIRDLTLSGGSTRTNNTGIWFLDTLAMFVQNVSILNLQNGVLMENKTTYQERHFFQRISVVNCHNGFLIQRDAGADVSAEHSHWSDILFNTGVGGNPIFPGDAVFHLTGGVSMASSVIENVNGNFSHPTGDAYIFLLDNNGSLSNIMTGFITGFPESNSGGNAYGFYTLGGQNWVTMGGHFQINSGILQGGKWPTKTAFQYTDIFGKTVA